MKWWKLFRGCIFGSWICNNYIFKRNEKLVLLRLKQAVLSPGNEKKKNKNYMDRLTVERRTG